MGLEILERQDWQKKINRQHSSLIGEDLIIETTDCIIVPERDCGLELLHTSMTYNQSSIKVLLNEYIPALCFLIFLEMTVQS